MRSISGTIDELRSKLGTLKSLYFSSNPERRIEAAALAREISEQMGRLERAISQDSRCKK